jgi:hypothetical protein
MSIARAVTITAFKRKPCQYLRAAHAIDRASVSSQFSLSA